MKMKFGAIVTDGRGKIGGHVASKNRAGAYLRTKASPVNPSTTAQASVRNVLGSISQAWRGLTQAQRDSWNAGVASFATTDIFGDLRNPSGFNLFQRLNNNLAIVGIAAIDVCPAPMEVPAYAISGLTVSLDPSFGISLTMGAAVPAGFKLQIFATPAISAGVSFVKSEFRQIKVVASGTTTPIALALDWSAKFGSAPSAGQKIFVKTYLISSSTGQAGVASQKSAIASI